MFAIQDAIDIQEHDLHRRQSAGSAVGAVVLCSIVPSPTTITGAKHNGTRSHNDRKLPRIRVFDSK
jgi:hypothetical protein